MKVRRKNKIVLEKPEHTCEECAFSEVDKSFINRSVKGEYFMLKCPFISWKVFHHSRACDRFYQKEIETKQQKQ